VGSATYDANGNLVSRVYDSIGPNIYYYVHDAENQLIEMQTDTYYTSAANRFKTGWLYDGLGRVRVRTDYNWYEPYGVWSMVENVRYIYDGRRVIQERNSGNTPTVSYTRGNDLSGSLEGAGGIGGLLGRSHGYSGGNWSTHNHYHADGNGNVTYLVNSSQGLAASYRYDPYGRVISWSGSLTNANVYRFSSKEVHAKSGMYYYGFRFYEPHLQRWVNRDPIGVRGGINLYAFVANGPTHFLDAYGLRLIIDPGSSPGFQQAMQSCICQLARSPRGMALLLAAQNSPLDITLTPDPRGRGAGTGRRSDGKIIWWDSDNPNGIGPNHPILNPWPDDPKPHPDEIPPNNWIGCAVVLAHELGHAALDANDEIDDWTGLPTGGNNIGVNENPVRRYFGLPPRRHYHGYPIPPGNYHTW
jgi:RHS repeat-associated protein